MTYKYAYITVDRPAAFHVSLRHQLRFHKWKGRSSVCMIRVSEDLGREGGIQGLFDGKLCKLCFTDRSCLVLTGLNLQASWGRNGQ